MRDVLRAAALLFLAGCWGCNDTVRPEYPPETPVPGTLADDPAWSPTSRDTIVYRRLAVGAGWDYSCVYGIFLLDLRTGEEELLVPMGHYPRWSPDGRRLAYVIGESAAAEIYVMDLAARAEEQVTHSSQGSFLYDWSPEGTRLVFGSNVRLALCIMQVASPDPAEWTCFERGLVEARWAATPLGEKIAYCTGTGNNWVTRLMNPDGSERVQLTHRLGEAEEKHSEPEWAPDGEKIIFRRQEHPGRFSEHSEIWSIRHDGSGETLLNADAPTWTSSEMTWSPDGSKIAYVAVAPDTAGRAHTVWVMEADGSDPRVLVYPDSVAAEAVWR